MAFTSKSERLLNFSGINPSRIDKILASKRGKAFEAPAHKEYKVSPSNVPFNSSSERNIDAIPKTYNPGPGVYDANVGFDALQKRRNSIMHSILMKLQASKAPFNSNIDRFSPNQNKSATKLLGPGQYYNPQEG